VRQDEADQDSQALAGLSKGTLSVARIRSPNPALCDHCDMTGEIPASWPGNAPTADVQLARRFGIPKTHIDRLFSPRHYSRLDHIEAAFAALGKRLHVEARNAA